MSDARPEVHFSLTSATGTGPPPVDSQDRFGPKYLVGNVPEGDSAVAYSTAGFIYIPDPGDGTGIENALAAAGMTGGDVWARPGLYDFELGAVTGALTVPLFCRLRGAGGTTRIQTRSTGNQGAFILSQGAEVSDMTITAPAPANGAGVQRGLVAPAGDLTFVRRVSFQTAPATGALRYCISVQAGGAGTTRRVRLEDIECNTTTTIAVSADPAGGLEVVPGAGACIITFSKFRSLGGDVAVFDPSVLGNGITQLIGEQMTLDEWLFAAIRWRGVGQITNLNMTTNGPDATAQAVNIATRPGVPSTVLRDVWLDPKGSIVVGVAFTKDVNGSVGLAPMLDGLTYSGAATISILATLASSASRAAVISRVAVLAGVNVIAVQVKDGNPDAVVERCTIQMLGTSGRIGVSTSSARTRVKNNTVSLLASGSGGVGSAIASSGTAPQCIVNENNIVTVNAADVGMDMTGNTNGNVVGNILDMATDANAFVNVPVTCNVDINVVV